VAFTTESCHNIQVGDMKAKPHRIIEFQATILDRDNKPLATGLARLYGMIGSGEFCLEKANPTLPLNAARLLRPDGSRYLLRNFKARQAGNYDFDYSFQFRTRKAG
jgi:hypothetical protein